MVGVGDGDRGGSGERLEVEGGERREGGEVENTTWATARPVVDGT